jgi:hypothetical protein
LQGLGSQSDSFHAGCTYFIDRRTNTACRQGACPIPADTTFPKMASAIGGFVTSFDKAPRIAMLPSSDPLRLAKEPENLAIGVRAMLQITAQLPEALDMILLSLYGE